jgi:hypothetical protein
VRNGLREAGGTATHSLPLTLITGLLISRLRIDDGALEVLLLAGGSPARGELIATPDRPVFAPSDAGRSPPKHVSPPRPPLAGPMAAAGTSSASPAPTASSTGSEDDPHCISPAGRLMQRALQRHL